MSLQCPTKVTRILFLFCFSSESHALQQQVSISLACRERDQSSKLASYSQSIFLVLASENQKISQRGKNTIIKVSIMIVYNGSSGCQYWLGFFCCQFKQVGRWYPCSKTDLASRIMPEIRRWKCQCCQALNEHQHSDTRRLKLSVWIFLYQSGKASPHPLHSPDCGNSLDSCGNNRFDLLSCFGFGDQAQGLTLRYPWPAPSAWLAYLFIPFCFLTLLFAAFVPPFLCPRLLFPIGHGFATFIPKLGILQGDVTCERYKQLHSDFPPLPAPSWPLKMVQHV